MRTNFDVRNCRISNFEPQELCAAARIMRLTPFKEGLMRKATLLAAAILIVSSVFGQAAPRGASQFTPGEQMRDSGRRGASEFSPGDRMRDTGGPHRGSRGASEFSPGDRMNDMRHR